ncbi:LPXTG cell wall anchor domain-containing protein [Ligilactobacillus aviarius]|uniref:LPXTG cell wall anchor domain-containing protein n=1 Tax=Ligilactobacillus aviarius TaxID=1606 RepID=UPI0024B8C8AC|nr:LPXTG cell wall anchor domain-containing protein [Ligilactobacillus aviarius]
MPVRTSSQTSSLVESQSSGSEKIDSSSLSDFQQSSQDSEIQRNRSIEFGSQTIEVSGSSQQGFASSRGVNENNYNYQNEERNANVDREVQTSSFVSNGASSSSLLLKNSNSSSSVKSIVSKNIVKKSITGSSLKKNQQVIPQTDENSSLIAIGGIILLLTFGTLIRNKKF